MPSATIVVWVLIMWTGQDNVVIDNIASRQNCEAVKTIYNRNFGNGGHGTCIAVRKVRQ